MRDWRKYVRERLAEAGERDDADEQVVRELSDHLDDVYTELRASGLTQAQALRRTSRQVGNWLELRRGIQAVRQEGEMQEHVKQFWLPSLVTLLLGWGILAILIWSGVAPFMTSPGRPDGLYVYWPWLVALPFVGALGAYMSRRTQASRWKVYAAGAFPVIAIAIVFLLVLPWSFIVDRQVVPALKLSAIAADMMSWVVIPGVALCLGIAAQGMRTPRPEKL